MTAARAANEPAEQRGTEGKVKKYIFIGLAAGFLAACATATPQVGTNAGLANDMLAECTADELVNGMRAALENEDVTPVPAQIADGVIARCDVFYSVLEDALIEDGEDPEVAKQVAENTRLETRAQLIGLFTVN